MQNTIFFEGRDEGVGIENEKGRKDKVERRILQQKQAGIHILWNGRWGIKGGKKNEGKLHKRRKRL